jgi:hypothetical protein
MSKPKPSFTWKAIGSDPPPTHNTLLANSVTRAKPLQAISIPDNRIVGDSWHGRELTHYVVDASMWGGCHYRIKFYYDGATTMPRFMVRMDCTKHSDEAKAEAVALGETFLLVLNAIRKD